MTRTPLVLALRLALLAGVGTAASLAAAADEVAASPTHGAPTTGSHLPAGEGLRAEPVTVIDRAQIEASGDMTVAELLRDSTLAAFGNFRPQSGSTAQSLAAIDLRGLESGRTLVLIDGRRAPAYAMLPSSGTDLNAIPLAMVERIEILPYGASAIHGADAVGGVVNIVTRRMQGAELRYGVGDPAVSGGDLEEMSAVFGFDTGRTRLTGGAGKSRRGMTFTRDQMGGQDVAYSAYGNSYYDWETSRFVVTPGFACDTDAFYLVDGECSYDFNRVAAHEASVDNTSVFAQARHAITDDWDVWFAASAAKVGSFGRYAPTPGVLIVGDGTPNDINAGERCGDDGCFSDGLPTYYFHRFAAAGTRDNIVDSRVSDYALGFSGALTDALDVEFGVRRADYDAKELGRGYIIRDLAEAAAESGDYDLSDPFGADPAVVAGFTATLSREARHTRDEAFATGRFGWTLPTGESAVAFGIEAADEDLVDRYDSLSVAGAVLGTSGRGAEASRDTRSAWVEWRLPLAPNLHATLAGRHDRLDTTKTESLFSPKVSLAWQPLEWLGVRGSWGESFRAPALDQIGLDHQVGPVLVGNCWLLDCYTVMASEGGNAELDAEQATHWAVGIELRPTSSLVASVDYWDVEIDKRIIYLTPDNLHYLEQDGYAIPDGLSVVRYQSMVAGWGNFGGLRTRGVDVGVDLAFDLGNAGALRSRLALTKIVGYEVEYAWFDTAIEDTLGHPSLRATLRNTWNVRDLAFGWTVHHVGDNGGVGAWTTHDLSVSWEAPWNATVTVGATNVADRYPERVEWDERPWNFYLYDGWGRTTFLRYTQRF